MGRVRLVIAAPEIVNVDGVNKELGISSSPPPGAAGRALASRCPHLEAQYGGWLPVLLRRGRGRELREDPGRRVSGFDAKVFIGSLRGNSEFLEGMLDEVVIWNRALSKRRSRLITRARPGCSASNPG